MQLRKTCKSVGAVMLTIALLIGMMSVMGAFPAIAGETVKNWTFSGDWEAIGGASDGTFNQVNVSAVDAAFNVYYGSEGRFYKLAKNQIGNFTDASIIGSGSTMQLTTAEKGLHMYNKYGTWYDMRNTISLVPKTADGEEIHVKNFETSFTVNTFGSYSCGGLMLSFGSQEAGRVILDGTTPYAERAAVVISADGVGVIDGSAVSVKNAALISRVEETLKAAGTWTDFPDGIGCGNTGNNWRTYEVYVKVLNGKLTVRVYYPVGDTVALEQTTDITWDRYGAVYFSGLLFDNTVSDMTLTALNDKGQPVDVVGEPEFTFKMDNVATVGEQTWPYDFSADAKAAVVRDEIDAKFNTYYDWDATTTALTKDTLGTNVGGANTAIAKLTATGLALNVSNGGYSGGGMRQSYSFALKDADGEEIVAKNFEMTFKATAQSNYSIGGLMLNFRAQDSGKVAAAGRWTAQKAYNKRVAVFLSPSAAGVMDGSEADPEVNADLYGNPEKVMTPYLTDGVAGNGLNSSKPLQVYVKAVNGKVKLVVYNATTGTLMYKETVDVDWGKEGAIYFSALYGTQQISDVTFYELDDNGDRLVPEVIPEPDFVFQMDNSALGSFPYDFSADNDVNNAIRDAVDAKFNVYAGCEDRLVKVNKAELGYDNDNSNWDSSVVQMKAAANGLYMITKNGSYSTGGGVALRNYMSLVPKNQEGAEINAKNFEVEFDLITRLSSGYGAGLMLMFRSQDSGRVAVNATTPYAQRAGVLISSLGVKVLDGAETSVVDENMAKAPFKVEGFYTPYTSGGGASLDLSVHVYVKVLDNSVTVKVTKEDTVIHESTTAITWDRAGTISFSGMAMWNTVSNIELRVEEEKVQEPDYVFEPDFSAAGSTFPYDFSEDNTVNNGIRDTIDAAFNLYAGCASDFGRVEKVDFGKDNDFGSTWNGSVSQLRVTANGLNINNVISPYENLTMRNYLSLVPKDANGDEIYAKDFEVSFRLTTSMAWSHGGFMLQFGSQDSGRTALSSNVPYASRAAVLITSAGAMILDGTAGSPVNEALYQKPHTCAAVSAFPSGCGVTNGTAPEMEVYVKVLDGKVIVKLTQVGKGAPFLTLEDTITWTKEGTIAFTGLFKEHTISNVKLTLLEGAEQGGEEEEVDKPENTETVKDLVDSGRAMTLGRVTWEGTTAKLPFALAGVRIAGNLYGKVTAKMQASSSPGSFVTVVVDGDYENATTTWVETGITTFTAVENLEEGYHTVEILRSSSAPYAATSIFNISYNGTLEMPTYGDFQMEFIGDSITGGEGNWDTSQGKNTYSVQFCNSYETYAAKTARALGAEINVLATCGWTTAQATSAFSGLGNPDIVVINLGTNLYGIDDAQLTSDVKALIAKVRAAYGEDTYIVWAYGMMYTEKVAVIEAAVDEMAAADEKLFFCDLSAAQNQAGTNKHPDAQGHTDAANILVPFLRAKCGLKEVIVDTFEQGTVETVKSPVEGSETLVQYTFTVIPEEGAQLKAGSLKARVKGSDGVYTIMPQRVGFRDPANLQSEQFVFVAEGELEITAEFYTPADAKDANMAMLATSKSTTAMGGQYGNAVRFVSRSYVYQNGGKFYMDIDGQAKEVQDFGMYVTSRMALDRMGFDTIAGALQSGQTKNIVKRSVPEAGQAIGKLGVFYDYCSAYADMSIQIININDAHVDREIVSCAYVLFADGQVVYTDDAARSHSEA